MFINLNGRILEADDAGLPHDNRAFRYGFGLFETLLCCNGAIELAHYHWHRLFAGMKQLHFTVPKLFTPAFLEQEILKIVKKNKLEALCRIRLQVWPGNGGLYDAGDPLQYLIECFALDEQVIALNDNGLVIGIAEGIAKSCDILANLKTCNALPYAVAARQAKANRWNDALLLNDKGRIAESTIANIFWVKEARIYTPPLTEGCINGVMRRHLFHTSFLKSFLIEEALLTPGILQDADEIFLTNAIRKIKWVSDYDGKSYSNAVTAKLAAALG